MYYFFLQKEKSQIQNLVLNLEKFNSVKNRQDSENIFSEAGVIILLDVWIDNTVVEFERLIFQPKFVIPIGTICAVELTGIPTIRVEVEIT